MRKEINNETGEWKISFSKKELKKIKYIGIGIGVFLFLLLSAAVYSIYMMTSLRAENQLYRNQMKLAQERMESLIKKSDTVEKLSSEVQSLVHGNTNQSENGIPVSNKGQGGATTVPDKAENISSTTITPVSNPGQLLMEMVELDTKLDKQIKAIVRLRSVIISQFTGDTTIFSSGSSLPSIWPVQGEISSGFGFRQSPGGIGTIYHEGLDIAASYGDQVKATANGKVTQAGWASGYGYLVEIDHGNGIKTRYGHNSALFVSVGDKVVQGQTISLIGSTGNSTGPHCHYEVRINGDAVNPTLFLPNR